MSVNSAGSGAHNVRSINVRANLLAEWTTDQVRFRSDATRYGAIILLGLVVAAISIPLLESYRGGFRASIARENQALAALKTQLDEANAAKKEAEPQLAAVQVSKEASGYFDRLLGETYSVLDSAKSGMAFTSAKAEVRAAEISIDCHAEAENYDVAQAFAAQAGEGAHKISSLASLRPGGGLGEKAITFEYVKRVAIK